MRFFYYPMNFYEFFFLNFLKIDFSVFLIALPFMLIKKKHLKMAKKIIFQKYIKF